MLPITFGTASIFIKINTTVIYTLKFIFIIVPHPCSSSLWQSRKVHMHHILLLVATVKTGILLWYIEWPKEMNTRVSKVSAMW